MTTAPKPDAPEAFADVDLRVGRIVAVVLGAVGDDGVVRLLRPDEGAKPGDPIA